jgi:hypothetical protein
MPPPTRGREKMLPMDRHTPYPLKQFREKQETKAKALAAQNKQKACAMKEKEKQRATKATETQANADHKTSIVPMEYPNKEALNNSAQQPLADPEILPDITQTEDNVDTPVGNVADISLDYTLTDEGKGDNISGNKEKRNDGDTEDETNLKKPKVPLQPLKPTK